MGVQPGQGRAATPATWPASAATLGVAATGDVDALLALRPDCIVHTAMADNRLMEALDDLERLLRAGINVVSSGPVFLQYPTGVVDDAMIDPLRQAAAGRWGLPVRERRSTPGSPTTSSPWC